MKFNLLCISCHLLVATNLVESKSLDKSSNVVIRESSSRSRTQSIARTQDITNTILSGCRHISSNICISPRNETSIDVLSSEDFLVESDKRLDSKATTPKLASSTEVTSWGIEEVLQDITFWDENIPPPSGEIKVCIVGSGYDLGHPDLPSETDVTGVDSSWSDEAWSVDVLGTGTHSAGTIAAIGNNDKGVKGIVHNNHGGLFKLIIGKAAWGNDGTGSLSAEIEAVTSCHNQGAKVIVVTMGSECYSQIEAEFYQDIHDAGILVFAASGDDGDETLTYPASLPTVISVATSNSNKKWDGSQMNDQVELTAPGSNITSTIPNGEYGTMSGTAMSAAHAGGVAGLLWMYFPTCSSSQIRAVLAKTALDLGEAGCDEKFGHGLIQAKAAYELLNEGKCGDDIGSTTAVGGCLQLKSPVLSDSCSSNSDCDDNDPCTVDTCQSSVCSYDHDCAGCGLSSLVSVDITTDDFPEETSWEILDYSTYERVMAKNTSSYGNCGKKYSKSQCLGEGGYLFVIHDTEGDGMCCDFGIGRYEVKVGDERKVLGGQFKSSKSHFFSITNTPTTFSPTKTRSPVTQSTSTSISTGPTRSPTSTGAPTTLRCTSDSDCDDHDDCTDDTCGVDSMCSFAVNCASCGLTSEITVDVLTDFHPEETSWEIKKYKTNKIIAKSSGYKAMAHSYSTKKCIDKGIYVFSIFDSSDDGICCANFAGSYTVSVDGTTKATGGEFKSAEMHLIAIDDTIATSNPRNPIPTWAPTNTEEPTGSPTDTQMPSDIPSDLPTLMPSKSPSTNPSSFPSESPTAWCAKVTQKSQFCNSELIDEAPTCCGDLVCFGDHCVPQCGKEGETTLQCDISLGSDYYKPKCCPGLECGDDKMCRAPPEETIEETCAAVNEISKDCKPSAPAQVSQSCCENMKCDGSYCVTHCAKVREVAKECDPNASANSPNICCDGLTCNDKGKCSYPDWCAKAGEKSKCCGATNANDDTCCTGLVCNAEKRCVEKPVCARDANAKECGARWSNYEACCDGYVCGGKTGKTCVKSIDEKVCGKLGRNVIECGLCPSQFPGKKFEDIRQICCEGFVCLKDHSPRVQPSCIRQYAPKYTSSIQCGDSGSNYAMCEVKHECNPLPGSKQCIGKTLPGPEGVRAKECGAPYAKYNFCGDGLVCDYDKDGPNFMKCVAPADAKVTEYTETTFCALENENARECTDAPYAVAETCCPGLKCEAGTPSKSCVAA